MVVILPVKSLLQMLVLVFVHVCNDYDKAVLIMLVVRFKDS